MSENVERKNRKRRSKKKNILMGRHKEIFCLNLNGLEQFSAHLLSDARDFKDPFYL